MHVSGKLGVTLSIGGISFALDAALSQCLPSHLENFVCDQAPDVWCRQQLDCPSLDGLLFQSTQTWRLEKTRKGVAICMLQGHPDVPYQVLLLDDTLCQGQVYIDRLASQDKMSFGLQEPLFELWTTFLLGKARGILVHGVAVEVEGRAYVFVGKSGIGKSTLAHIFTQAQLGRILTDDRIIIRTDDEFNLCAYGTPWNGELQFADAGYAPIEAIYFLEQAPRCSVQRLKDADATTRLYANCFLAGWPRAETLQHVLNSAAWVTDRIKCYNLSFTPDRQVLLALGFNV